MVQDGRAFLGQLAERFDLQLVYAFGSRASEVLAWVNGLGEAPLTAGESDVDIGVKSRQALSVEQKVRIAIALEDKLGVARADLVCLEQADAVLAADIIGGERVC